MTSLVVLPVFPTVGHQPGSLSGGCMMLIAADSAQTLFPGRLLLVLGHLDLHLAFLFFVSSWIALQIWVFIIHSFLAKLVARPEIFLIFCGSSAADNQVFARKSQLYVL